MGNFYSLCLLDVPVQKEIIKKWKKNYWALFWYINELVPSCTEATVLIRVRARVRVRVGVRVRVRVRVAVEVRVSLRIG